MDQVNDSSADPLAWQGYCRGCGYMLRGLESDRCPECGRAFDRGNRRTFRTTPLRPWWRLAVRAAAVLLILALIPAAGVTWLWWGWRQEQPAVEFATERGGSAQTMPIGPQWLQDWMPVRHRWLLERVWVIWTNDAPAGEPQHADTAPLRTLKHAHNVILTSPDTEDAWLAHLGRLRKLRILDLNWTPVTDEGLVHLQKLRDLESLALMHTKVRGPGLKHLEGMNLRWLNLSRTPLEPQYLQNLQGVMSLEELFLDGTAVDDVSLQHVAQLPKLKRLELRGTSVTDEGLRTLAKMNSLEHLSLPQAAISDEGIRTLAEMANLQVLEISLTNGISAETMDAIQKALPNTTIQRSRHVGRSRSH